MDEASSSDPLLPSSQTPSDAAEPIADSSTTEDAASASEPRSVGEGAMPAVDWEAAEEVGEGVRKVVLRKGREDGGRPLLGAVAFAHYRAWVRSSGSKVQDSWQENQQLELILGSERKDLKGLSIGLRAMSSGERALLSVPYPLAYGEEGCFSFPSVPPRSDMLYEVALSGFDNPSQGRSRAHMTVEERLECAEKRRQSGNALFREDNAEEALREYEMALGYMGEEFMLQMYGKYRDMANAVRLPCLLNSAACHLKLLRYNDAIALCSSVLAEEPNNGKALFRRGKARLALGQTEAAKEDLRRAQKAAPTDGAVVKALGEIKAMEKEERDKEKEMYKGIFRAEQPGRAASVPWWKAVWKWLRKLSTRLTRWLWRSKRD